MANFNPNALKIFNGKFDATKWNKIVDQMLRQHLRSGPNYQLQEGAGGTVIVTSSSTQPSPGWPFKVYNTTKGETGQVQINGFDGFVGTINGNVANVNGSPIDTPTGTPPVYPQLSISGNGVVYIYITLNGSGGVTEVDVYYGGTLPSADTATPPLYAVQILATISSYSVDGTGNVSFGVNNATNYGFTSVTTCGNSVNIY